MMLRTTTAAEKYLYLPNRCHGYEDIHAGKGKIGFFRKIFERLGFVALSLVFFEKSCFKNLKTQITGNREKRLYVFLHVLICYTKQYNRTMKHKEYQ